MNMRSGTFCTIFPGYKDSHFFKDPGQVPYRFSKLGYAVSLVCYSKKQKFPDTEKYLKVTRIPDWYISRKFNTGMVIYLLCNSRKIDILNTFHLTWSSLLYIFLFKSLNKNGFGYIKLDNCALAGAITGEDDYSFNGTTDSGNGSLKQRIKSWVSGKVLIKKVDLFSVEDEYSKELYEAKYHFLKEKLITVYNGHTSDLPGSVNPGQPEDKEDIIMTAGRLGTYQKATEILLDAFKRIAPLTNYNLHLAGTIEPSFQTHLELFFHTNPDLSERVIFHGSLGREALYRLYCRAKIFCMPSRYEGMAIVFPEAMYYGNVIVTTKNVSLKYLIDKFRVGFAVDKDNPNDLANALLKLINDRELRENTAQRAHEISATLLDWDNIIKILQLEIETRFNREKR